MATDRPGQKTDRKKLPSLSGSGIVSGGLKLGNSNVCKNLHSYMYDFRNVCNFLQPSKYFLEYCSCKAVTCVIAYMPVKSFKILALQWHHQQNDIKATNHGVKL